MSFLRFVVRILFKTSLAKHAGWIWASDAANRFGMGNGIKPQTKVHEERSANIPLQPFVVCVCSVAKHLLQSVIPEAGNLTISATEGMASAMPRGASLFSQMSRPHPHRQFHSHADERGRSSLPKTDISPFSGSTSINSSVEAFP